MAFAVAWARRPTPRCEPTSIPGSPAANSKSSKVPQDHRHANSRPRKPFRRNRKFCERVGEGRRPGEPTLSPSSGHRRCRSTSHLNRSQKSVVEDVLSSPDRIQGIQGYAGTGKTTTLSVDRSSRRNSGIRGRRDSRRHHAPLANSPKQASKPERCKDSWHVEINRETSEKKHFYFVDESSLASTNQMREFLSRLGPQIAYY